MRGEEVVAVVCNDVTVVVFGDDELVARGVICDTVAVLGDSVFVCGEKPLSGEDGASFELVHLRRCVPGGGQGTDGLLLFLRRDSGGTEVVP